MLVAQARSFVRDWIAEHATPPAALDGAYLSGSINWLPDDADLPATSDVDLWLVRQSGDIPTIAAGKRLYRGLIVDVSLTSFNQLSSADTILADYHIAPSFARPNVVFDGSGRLSELQAIVAAGFSKPRWVRRRCEHARDNVLRYVRSLDESQPLHDQAMACLFAAGVTTHVLLTAGLRNPTVRRRYVAVRDLLDRYDRLDVYETLMKLLGCQGVSREQVEHHLAALTEAFDAAKAVVRTQFPFASDISDIARAIAIDGSRELIDRGDHREAMFWIAVTYSRCQKILHADAPELVARTAAGYEQLLADLGIATSADMRARAATIEALLPGICTMSESIMGANPRSGP